MFFVIKNYGNDKGCFKFWIKKININKKWCLQFWVRVINKEIRVRLLR